MPLWVRLYRAWLSLAPRFKREYGDDATRDDSRLIAREEGLRGRAASRWIALAGVFDALKAAAADRAGQAPALHSFGPDARQALRLNDEEAAASGHDAAAGATHVQKSALTARFACCPGPSTARSRRCSVFS